MTVDVDAPVCVAFAADGIMAKGLAAAARSVADRLAERGREGRLFVVDCGVPRRARQRIERSLWGTTSTITWLPVRGAAAALLRTLSTRSTRPYPPAAYARLLLPALLPADVERVMYLDADMIARHDVLPLWNEPMGDDVLFAVRDLPLANGNAARIARTVDQELYPYAADSVYFQSGLLVLDIRAFREEHIAERAFELLAAYPMMQFPDQDALNALLTRRSRLVDPRWNQMTAVYSYPDWDLEESPFAPEVLAELQDDPLIVHYSGRPKPWELGCQHPLVEDWFASLDRTHWHGWRPTRVNSLVARVPRVARTLRKKIVRALPARWR